MRRTVVLVLGLAACGTEPQLPPATSSDSTFHALEYEFITHGRGRSSGHALTLTSRARGRLTIVPIDDPPLLAITLAVDESSLFLGEQVVARVEPGTWSLIARRNAGAIDALWVPADMPRESKNLARFLVAELPTPEPNITVREEQTPLGVLEARYASLAMPYASFGLRVRSSSSDHANEPRGAALLLADARGPVIVAAAQLVHMTVSENDELDSVSAMLLVRDSVTTHPSTELSSLRDRVEVLSRSPPISLVEEPLTDEQKQEIRRGAETWGSVRARLLASGAEADPTLLHRTAAHLSADAAHTGELLSLASAPATSEAARAAMYLALGECGSAACQAALLEALARDVGARDEVLAALARVDSPTIETVDQLLELDTREEGLVHAVTGVVLSRLAEHDPTAGALRLARLVEGLTGCPAALEELFPLLGNAGLPASEPVLRVCFEPGVDDARRAAAAGAMRRIPGAGVTSTLVLLVAEDRSPSVRVASLRALLVRDVRDEELGSLHVVNPVAWGAAEQELLLDILERVTDPGEMTVALATMLERSQSEDVATRARLIAGQLRGR